MLRRIARRLPTADWLLNHVVARIPYANARMRAYARFGVNIADPTRALLMLNSEIIDPRRLWLEEGAIVGKHCLLDARGTLRIGRIAACASMSCGARAPVPTISRRSQSGRAR